MTKRIAINGLGRIGTCVLRAYFENMDKYPDMEIVAANTLFKAKDHELLVKYDSTHGKFAGTVEATDDALIINGKTVKIISEPDITKLPWKELDIDIVFECTGRFVTEDDLKKHLASGAKKAMLSAPAKSGNVKTVVLGVNHEVLEPSDTIISIGSCTTNCLSPVAKILNDALGIVKGHMTTIHAYTNDQSSLDTVHKDPRRGRACAVSMIPTSTGAAKAVALAIPELKGKLDGCAMRVPTPDVSIVDLTFTSNKETTAEEVNKLITEAAKGKMKGVLAVSDEALVSVDFTHNPHSSIFDLTQTKVINGNLVRIASWYDNEWGFSNRMLDVAHMW